MKAFPVPRYVNSSGGTFDPPIQGMDLRDYFAAKALQGYLSNPATHRALNDEETTQKMVVETCYGWADAMMKAKEDE